MDSTGRTRSTAKQQSKTSPFQINNNMSATRLVDCNNNVLCRFLIGFSWCCRSIFCTFCFPSCSFVPSNLAHSSGTSLWSSTTFAGELLLIAVCCVHAKVSYTYRAGFPLVEPALGCLAHSQVSYYCWWLSAVCMQSWVTLTGLGSHLWNLPLVVWHIHRWVTAAGSRLCVCVCAKASHGCVHNHLWNLLLAVYHIHRWVSESCLLCACKVELQSLVNTCGTSSWLSTTFTDELLLVAVCVCPKVMLMCVCVSEGESWLVSQWFVEPPVGSLPNSQVSYYWWLLSVVCMQSWVTEFGSHLWNLPMVIFHIHRCVTTDGCLLCVSAKASPGLVHNNLWNLLLVVYHILCWLRSVKSL